MGQTKINICLLYYFTSTYGKKKSVSYFLNIAQPSFPYIEQNDACLWDKLDQGVEETISDIIFQGIVRIVIYKK